jgi:hypothetical protein
MTISGSLSTTMVASAVAGALVVLVVVLAVVAIRRNGAATISRALWPIASLVLAGLAVTAILDRMAMTNQSAERNALFERSAALTAGALAPGSALACLDGGAGEVVGNACEKAVFADAQTAAAAVAFTAARLALLRDASALAQQGDAGIAEAFAPARRAIELDRYGVAAHVLSTEDGCAVDRCPAFAWVNDSGVLKANMKVHAFETYVDRYAANWGKPVPPAAEAPGPSAAATPAPAPAQAPAAYVAPEAMNPPPNGTMNQSAPALGRPVDPKWTFPSSDSIPPVSIMNPEPARPKGEQAQASQPTPAAGAAEAPVHQVPVPPRRPQAAQAPQSLAPPAR